MTLRFQSISTLCAAGLLAACATGPQPLPKDVTRVSTLDIVQAIRCEARAGVRDEVLKFLEETSTKASDKIVDRIKRGDPPEDIKLEQLATESDLEAITKLKEQDAEAKKDPARRVTETVETARLRNIMAQRSLIEKYRDTAIVLNFDFEIDEDNNDTTNLSFNDPLTNGGLFALTVKSVNSRKRKNRRKFTTSDTFRGLFTEENLPRSYCEFDLDTDPSRTLERGLYPVSGKIGLSEVFETFIRLSEVGGLGDPTGKALATFTDELTFVTVFSGGLDPKLTIGPGNGSLAELSGSYGAGRTDKHFVSITFAVPKPKVEKPAKPVNVVITQPVTLATDGSVIAQQDASPQTGDTSDKNEAAESITFTAPPPNSQREELAKEAEKAAYGQSFFLRRNQDLIDDFRDAFDLNR